MNSPLVTIAIPVVKTRFLRSAIDSAVNQDYQNTQVLLVDNFADADVRSFLPPSDEVDLFRHTDRWDAVTNLNYCLEKAQGEYFVWFSDDDILHPGFVSSLLGLMQKYPNVNVCRCGSHIINEQDQVIDSSPAMPEWESQEEFAWNRIRYNRNLYLQSFLWNREMLKHIGGLMDFEGHPWCTDVGTSITMAEYGGVAQTSARLLYWRRSSVSGTREADVDGKLLSTRRYSEFLDRVIDDWDTDVADIEPDLVRYWKQKHISRMIRNILQGYAIQKSLLVFLTRYRLIKEYNIGLPLYLKSFLTALVKKITRGN